MYTFNTQLGIGQVQSIINGMANIYFEDADTTKNVPLGFVKIYATEEDAEESSIEPMTTQELEAILLADKQRHIDFMNNQEAIRLMNQQTSINCAKSF